MIKVHILPILQDNYCYILESEDGAISIVDPGEAAPVLSFLADRGWTPNAILNTHAHPDHVGGNREIVDLYPQVQIFNMHNPLRSLSGEAVEIIETPGHTLDHICYYFPQSGVVFTGDTLFSMGCGRLFEGSPEQMWQSLEKLMALPDETLIYCGHEYTLSNGEFCETIEPDNEALQKRVSAVCALRARGKPSLPVTLALEKETNVFLRAGSAARFAEIRALKDAH